jgi:hypothetical protein
VIGFPLLIIPFAIYNMIAFITPMDWGTKLFTFRLMSGIEWSPTLSDAFLVFSLLLLLFEFTKSAKHGKSLIEHFLSLVLACGAGAEFVMVDKAGTSTFMLFVAICLVDLFAGFAAAFRRARRRVVVVEEAPVVAPAPAVVRTEPARVEPARVEPARAEPAPSPFTPAAEPVVKVDPVQKIGS